MPALSTPLAATLALPLLLSASSVPDKSGYSFLNRTPEALLRDLSTDRPDLTESPYTVDAGWWQAELDLVAYTRNHDTDGGADVQTRSLSLATLNLKVGLTSAIDLQTVVETWTRQREHDRLAGTRDRRSGFGDITSRLKVNLWGNDGGRTAFALMPFVKWPTNRHGLGNDSVEGGLIAPLAVELPGGWGLGLMTELDVVRNAADDGYAADWLNTVTVSRDIVGNLAGFLELTHLSTRGRDQATFDCGLTYGIGRHMQLDVGANLGLTRATDDLTVFTGLSIRF